jgi:hypothetical protein
MNAAGDHEVVMQRERLDRHAIRILMFPCGAHAHGATGGDDTVKEWPRVIGISENRSAKP